MVHIEYNTQSFNPQYLIVVSTSRELLETQSQDFVNEWDVFPLHKGFIASSVLDNPTKL